MEPPQLAIRNVNVFDSAKGQITGPIDVAVQDGLISSLTPSGSTEFAGDITIDGTGKTLIPGLIDAHWHAVFTTISAETLEFGEIGYVFARAVVSARETLLRGFTTVRDVVRLEEKLHLSHAACELVACLSRGSSRAARLGGRCGSHLNAHSCVAHESIRDNY